MSIRVVPSERGASVSGIPEIIPGGITPVSYSGVDIDFSEDFYVSNGEVNFRKDSIGISAREGQETYHAISNDVNIQGDRLNPVELCSTTDCYLDLRDTNKVFTSPQGFSAEAGGDSDFLVHLDESMREINPRGRYLALSLEDGGSAEVIRDDTVYDNDFDLNLDGNVRVDNGISIVRSDGERLISSRRLIEIPWLGIPVVDRRVLPYNPHTASFADVTGSYFSDDGERHYSLEIRGEDAEIVVREQVFAEPRRSCGTSYFQRFHDAAEGKPYARGDLEQCN